MPNINKTYKKKTASKKTSGKSKKTAKRPGNRRTY